LFAPIFSNLVKIQQVKSAICNQSYHLQVRFVVSLRFARTNMQLVTLCDGFSKLCFLMGSIVIYQIFMSALLCNVTMSKLFYQCHKIYYGSIQKSTWLFSFFWANDTSELINNWGLLLVKDVDTCCISLRSYYWPC
jgi:hypothetical protein